MTDRLQQKAEELMKGFWPSDLAPRDKYMDCYEKGIKRGLTAGIAMAAERHHGPCYEEGVIEGLEYAANLTDRFEAAGLNLKPLAEEIRKLKSHVFEPDNLTGGPACEVIEPYPWAKPALAKGETQETYRVVYIATGKTFEGGLPPTPNRQALVVALAEMMEIVSYWRGKLEVRP